jgi:hypothetical protein
MEQLVWELSSSLGLARHKTAVHHTNMYLLHIGYIKMHIGLYWGNLREGDHLEVPHVHGRIILKWIFERLGGGGIDWIDLAQDRDKQWALVYTVMSLRVP